MSSLSVGITLLDFEDKLLEAMAKELNKMLRASLRVFETRVRELIEKAIKESPEYASFQGGQLQAELGVRSPNPVIDSIISVLQSCVKATLNPLHVSGGSFNGGVSLMIYTGDLAKVLAVPGASFVSENAHTEIDWLNWLLTQGDRVLIQQWEFSPGGLGRSRTGLGIMIHTKQPWRVPAQFAGTEDDNWLTRSLSKLEGPVSEALEAELGRNIR